MVRVSPEFMTPVCVTAKGLYRSQKRTHTYTHSLPFNLRRGEGRIEWKREGEGLTKIGSASSWLAI